MLKYNYYSTLKFVFRCKIKLNRSNYLLNEMYLNTDDTTGPCCKIANTILIITKNINRLYRKINRPVTKKPI